jgi:hypothetical protein
MTRMNSASVTNPSSPTSIRSATLSTWHYKARENFGVLNAAAVQVAEQQPELAPRELANLLCVVPRTHGVLPFKKPRMNR